MSTSTNGELSYEEARVMRYKQDVRSDKRKFYIGFALIGIDIVTLIVSKLTGYSDWLDNVDQGSTVPQLLILVGSLIAWIAMGVIGALMAIVGLLDKEESSRALTAAIEKLGNAPTTSG